MDKLYHSVLHRVLWGPEARRKIGDIGSVFISNRDAVFIMGLFAFILNFRIINCLHGGFFGMNFAPEVNALLSSL